MALLAPAALALALLAVPILLLYMLRLRRREQPVSSTWLWRELVRDRAANAPWQRLRRNLLLFLQLLILAALVLALARPALRRPGLGGNLIVLLDASASMRASDGRPTRFDDARAAVERLISSLSGDDRLP
ncbi:MAG: VWA domain-containing protein, partial [Candidatus Promineofilum sp.]|nr:VWA domain-containing protein [Promineifilum sp.]